MALRQFTVRQLPVDPCPHQCSRWARYVGREGDPVVGPDGHKHNANCPVVLPRCGYCGSTEPLVQDSPDQWSHCPNCGGV